MTEKEAQLSVLMFAEEELNSYIRSLFEDDVLTEGEAQGFDSILIKINKVIEGLIDEENSPSVVYVIREDCHGIIGYHKTFESAKKQLMKDSGYEQLVKNVPLDYDGETRWGWDVLYIEKIELEE